MQLSGRDVTRLSVVHPRIPNPSGLLSKSDQIFELFSFKVFNYGEIDPCPFAPDRAFCISIFGRDELMAEPTDGPAGPGRGTQW